MSATATSERGRSLLRRLLATLIAFTGLLTLGFSALFAEGFVVWEGPEARFTSSLVLLATQALKRVQPALDDPPALAGALGQLVQGDVWYAQVVRAGRVVAEVNPLGVELPVRALVGAPLVERRSHPELGTYLDLVVPLASGPERAALLDVRALSKVLRGRGSVTITVPPARAQALRDRGYLRLGVSAAYLARAQRLRLGLSLLSFAAAFLIAWRFYAGLRGAIRELGRATHRLAQGDLTARVRLRSRDELEALGEAFNRMAEALARRTQELERAHAAKTRFLATLSHELRTPLQAILGYGRLLQRGLGGPLTPRGERFAVGLLAAAQHLLALVENALQFVKLEAGEERLQPTAFRLAELVEEAQREVEALAREKGVPLVVRLRRGSDRALYADRLKLERVLVNLLTNAVRAARGRVELRAGLHKGWAIFAVHDDGPGVPEGLRDRDRLFEPFQGQEGSGLGLGLAIVRRYVAMHGGRIRWRSRPGRGSRFAVAVPMSPPEARVGGGAP